MTCDIARAALLEADPADLRRETDSALSGHLRECAACRTAADAILDAEGATAAWIAARAPRHAFAPARARGGRAARHGTWRWAAGIAAAAGIAGVVLMTRPDRPPPAPPTARTAPALDGRATVAVRAPAGRNVAVFETADPDIVVIWLY